MTRFVQMKCTKCNELFSHIEYITVNERIDIPDSRGTANLVQKCKFCSCRGTILLDADTRKPYTSDKVNEYQPLIVMECRGIEPVDFDFRVSARCEWKCPLYCFFSLRRPDGLRRRRRARNSKLI